MKRREFMVVGACTVGVLAVARSFAVPSEPDGISAAPFAIQHHRLYGSPRTGCARIPGEPNTFPDQTLAGHTD